MYGPSSAPGMRTSNVSVFSYFVKRKKYEPHKVWVPGEEKEEECVEAVANALVAGGGNSDSAAMGGGVGTMSAMAQVR